MESMIGLLSAVIVKLCLQKEQTLKLLDWAACVYVIHTNCFVSHVKSFPVHTAPAGYICPACSTSIWPPKSVKDSGSRLHSKLREAIIQTGLEKNLLGNHPVPLHGAESRSPPPAFASGPLIGSEYNGGNLPFVKKDADSTARPENLDFVEIDGPSSTTSSLPNHEANFMKSTSPSGPGATTRKSTMQVERQSSEVSYYADDEDANRKKYSRRGTIRHKLLPFWSNALPTLPVTAPPQKDTSHGDDASDGRARRHKTSRMDPRKLLLIMAIMACMATMGILYYRIAQRGLGEEMPDDEPQ
ncbi:hypothetical protein DH2020_023956 [Rehmannia glutinosa]|uniref:ZFPL1-like U-box domain-containing protein n=1 Tax=Rehmannia glutinosa TaxID=99300 RepID=A0ABR0W868_REHGL